MCIIPLFVRDDVVIEFGEVGEMMDDYFSIIIGCSTWIIMKPKYLKRGKFSEISNFSQIGDTILPEIELLNLDFLTCSLLQVEKSLRVEILLTLREITSRFGIFSISCRS